MRVVIIIPTYNEAGSTPKMVDALSKVLPTITNHEVLVLYVDDTSPDGTGEIVKKLCLAHSWLRLLVNPTKGGLGMAYAVGMMHAMKELKADFVMEFDADFQHPPTDIPRMIAAIDGGEADYVIGSRYIPGGSIPPEWGLHRKILSVVGNLVARVCLFLPHLHDVTGGFKLSRTKGFLDRFDFNALLSRSFAYKIHILYFMVRMGARIKEVPFHFSPRDAGESKIISNEMFETLRVIWRLRLAGLQGELPGLKK